MLERLEGKVLHKVRYINTLLTITTYRKWSLVGSRSSAEQGKFAGQRPTFYRQR